MDKLFLNNLQDINKLLWWINQRGQFCPQNPVKSPRQNNHHHNQAVIQTRTPPNPKPLPSSGPSLPTWIYKPTPLHLSTLGKSHSVATFQRPPKSIGCLPSMKLWGFFLNYNREFNKQSFEKSTFVSREALQEKPHSLYFIHTAFFTPSD